jgi:hypothetical protein
MSINIVIELGKTFSITCRMGDESMLETAQERILLLKAGITGKQIEELYILYNNFKVVGNQRPMGKTIFEKGEMKTFCERCFDEVDRTKYQHRTLSTFVQ